MLQEKSFWKDAWVRHIEQYLAAPPRAGIWLDYRFPLREWRVIEIAGGSCRDARYLAERGFDVIGSDFDDRTLAYLLDRFPRSALSLQVEDAAAMTLSEKSVDLSVHNGFWVLFFSDLELVSLLREQARITRRVLIAIVHNAENKRLKETFSCKARTDEVYKIRFFNRDELLALVLASGLFPRSIRFEKFGGPTDRLFRLPGLLGRWANALVPRTYRWLPWSQVERIAMVLEL